MARVKTIAQTMAEFAMDLRYDAIPGEVVAAARRHLADTLACAVGASGTATVRRLREKALAPGGRAGATIIGTTHKVPVGVAARVNGTMVRELDANDIFVASRGGASGHFSDAAAALLALAESYQRSGKELITCLVASYELQGALAASLNFWDLGLHPLTNVAWTAPIVGARLAGAKAAQAVHACGFAVATGTVLNTWIRPSEGIPAIKSIAAGLVAQRAVDAAELAASGATATIDALETIFARQNPAATTPLVVRELEQLGNRWTMSRNMLKRYPAQIYTQAAIEAAVELHRKGIRIQKVRKLRLYGHRRTCGGVQGSAQAFAPASRETADHSTPYVLAMALLRGRLTRREYIGEPWKTAEVKRAMAKIELVIDAKLDRAFAANGMHGARLVATCNSGATEEIIVEQAKGHPDRPLNEGELIEKMGWLLPARVHGLNPQQLLDRCHSLSTAEDLRQLLKSCVIDGA